MFEVQLLLYFIQIEFKLATNRLITLYSHADITGTRSNGFVQKPGRRVVQNYGSESEAIVLNCAVAKRTLRPL